MSKREYENWKKWGKKKSDTFCLFRDLLDWVTSDDEADYFKDLQGNEIKVFNNNNARARFLHWSYKLKDKHNEFIGYRKADGSTLISEFWKLDITTYIIEYDEDTGEKYIVDPKDL